jgi:tRNA-splicing ligase RtcB (3'-phosphate/5'-hydroxy nucleic acid ligase)
MDKCKLPKEAKHLAWLSLDESEGQEYWAFMNLAGDYAKACHEVIHGKILKDLKLSTERTIQNHHNFAWKEKLSNGQEAIVHRKGATPAGKGDIGIIPGSMTSPTFIVKGLGNAKSINSSSHGAGRRMSRTKAFNNFTGADMSNDLIMNHVELIGGDIDESSFSYKDIRKVIGEQKELVEVIGEFTPWMVRMDGIGL